jgi:hypothetical protein
MPATIAQLLEAVFSMRSAPRLLKESVLKLEGRDSRVEAGSNTSTVALRVVGGDKKGGLKSETV